MIGIIITTRERFQMNPELKQQIIDIIKSNKPDGVVTRLKHIPELWNEIITNIPNLSYDNQAHKIYHYVNELAEIKKCPCGKPVSFQSLVFGYREFCSANCSFAKEAATNRRIAKMQANGGVGLANPKTRAKQQNKVSNTINANQLSPSENHTDETIREKILEIFTKTPKQYSSVIKNDPVIWPWVLKNNKLQGNSDSIAAKIYSAYYNESDVCPTGNLKKFDRWSSGFTGCGAANICACTQESISKNVTLTKSKYDDNKRKKIKTLKDQTMISKYGVAHNLQREDVKEKLRAPKVPIEIHDKLSDYSWMKTEYVDNQRSAADISNDLKVHYTTVIDYCRKHEFRIRKHSKYSVEERQISQYLNELGIDHETNDRSVLKNLEFDILIRDKHIAIEMNGVRWHAYDPNFKNPEGLKLEDPNRHLQKSKLAADLGIFLIHVTDLEWNNKREIIKSLLKDNLGLSKKINAVNYNIKNISKEIAQQFLETNHIQGSSNSSIQLGLYLNNELYMVLTAYKSNIGDNSIIVDRICAKLDIDIMNGPEHLINYLTQNINYKIFIHCDIQKSNGSEFNQIGLNLTAISNPNYFWTDMKRIISKEEATSTEFIKKLKYFDPMLNEEQNMWNNKYARYHDCGNFIFTI